MCDVQCRVCGSWSVSLYSPIYNAPSRSSLARARTSWLSCSHAQDLLPPSRSQLVFCDRRVHGRQLHARESIGDDGVHVLLDRVSPHGKAEHVNFLWCPRCVLAVILERFRAVVRERFWIVRIIRAETRWGLVRGDDVVV